MKSNKGIVLVALIFTVIVMIIIVNVTIKQTEETGIIENAEKANTQTESGAILEFFIAARSINEKNEANILETAQNFIKNNEISDIKYIITPDPFEKSYLYENLNEKIIIVEGQAGYYKFKISTENVEYIGEAEQTEVQLFNY